LKIQKVCVRLQVWVSFTQSKNTTQRLLQLVFGLYLCVDIVARNSHCSISGINNTFQSSFFVSGITFYGFHKIWNQVVSAFQRDVNIAPSILDDVSIFSKTVKNLHQKKSKCENYGNRNK